MVLNYSAFGVQGSGKTQEEHLLHQAKQFLQQKQYQEALDCCRQVLEKNAESADGYF
jgi:hypothetical protein